MPAKISVALAAKINLLLGEKQNSSQNKFICFIPPGVPASFKYSELNFFNTDGSFELDANTIELNRSGFAAMVNQVPADSLVFSTSDKGYLWNIFETIVEHNSITAHIELDVEDKIRLAAARNFCELNYANYRSYKNALDQCNLDYNEAKCSVEYATGEEKVKLLTDWNNFREKSLHERIKTAESDLNVLGKKAEVVSALDIIKNLETKKGIDHLKQEIHTKLQTLFSKGVPARAGTEYFYTDFSPLGSFDENSPSWNQIVLYNTEIDSLCNNASKDLQLLFEAESPVENIESITFEYTVVSVIREWFSEAFLSSRNWKFVLQGSVSVSDGESPAQGQIPAYINKIICIRKLSYKHKSPDPQPTPFAVTMISNHAIQDFNIKKNEPEAGPGLNITDARIHLPALVEPIEAGHHRATMITTPDKAVSLKETALFNRRKKMIARFHKTQEVVATPEPSRPTYTREISLEGVKFIAFECKRLTRCPDPDPTLAWP